MPRVAHPRHRTLPRGYLRRAGAPAHLCLGALSAWYWAAHPDPEGQVHTFSKSTQGRGGVCRCKKLAPAGVHRAMPTYTSAPSRYRQRGNNASHQHACKGNPSRYRHRSSPSRYRHPHPTLACPIVWWNLVIYGAHYAELKVNMDAVMEETGGEAPALIQ